MTYGVTTSNQTAVTGPSLTGQWRSGAASAKKTARPRNVGFDAPYPARREKHELTIAGQVLDSYRARACFVCAKFGPCAHREFDVELAYLSAASATAGWQGRKQTKRDAISYG